MAKTSVSLTSLVLLLQVVLQKKNIFLINLIDYCLREHNATFFPIFLFSVWI